MTKDDDKVTASPPAAKQLWEKIRQTFINNIGKAIGGVVATAAIAGAVAAWAALKTWMIVEIPSGLVVASLTECRDLRGGWAPFNEAGGRFIVGAGGHPKNPGVTKSYTAFTKDQITGWEPSTGGEEKHLLTIPEMPIHDHTASQSPYAYLLKSDSNGTTTTVDSTVGQPNLESSGRIQPQGGNQSHNIIPPYVALYYCKKT